MATVITGTFAGTPTSPEISGRKADIVMDFAGTASVDIERRLPGGTWIKIETAITADAERQKSYAAPTALRLNCTAHTNNVVYALITGADG